MVGRLCCSSVSARKEPIDIEALSDEVLLNILEQASKYEGHAMMRGTFPLVFYGKMQSTVPKVISGLKHKFHLQREADHTDPFFTLQAVPSSVRSL